MPQLRRRPRPEASEEQRARSLELPNPLQPGALWSRVCTFGLGRCPPRIEFGSYSLTKVIDAAGAPLEPHHSEFVTYMGDVPIFMWTGFEDDV